jgi:hypothetical protein
MVNIITTIKRIFFSWILLLATLCLTAQDEVHMLAGYNYTGKITSVTEDKVFIRRTNNKVASLVKSEIWKIVYSNGTEVVLNESMEELESRIGKIDRQETLEEIIREGNDKEAEVSYYFLIKKGYKYEYRDKHLSDFSERFPNSRYQRELESMSRFRKKLNESKEIIFKCPTPYTPEVIDRKANFTLQFTDQLRVSHTLEIEVILKFIRTYGKKAKLKNATEWKNDYDISFILDDSSEPVVLNDKYSLADEHVGDQHRIFLSTLRIGNLNLNGQIDIGTQIRKDNGEYLINIDIQLDYQNWYE